MTISADRRPRVAAYAWVVFALTFGLLISDYMARQVLNAVFPLLKVEWSLTDGQLGFLSGIVALMVGHPDLPDFASRRPAWPGEEHSHHGRGLERRNCIVRPRAEL